MDENRLEERIDELQKTELIDDVVVKSPLSQNLVSSAYSKDGGLHLSAYISTYINYALQQNHVAIIPKIVIRNSSLEDLSGLELRIEMDEGFIEPFSMELDTIASEARCEILKPRILLYGSKLAALTDQMTCVLFVRIIRDGEELIRITREIDVFPYNLYPARCPEDLLATFVMPNHPVVKMLIQLAAQKMKEWTGSPALEGYQSGDPERVLKMAAAAYAAIQKQNIVYAEPPVTALSYADENTTVSQEEDRLMGQLVRFPDEIMETRLGTCMDLTLLYASCLEAMGLHPILVKIKKHIFAGVWLVDEMFAESWTDDATQIGKRFAEGINQLAVVECTVMCAGRNIDFEIARKAAEETVATTEEFRSGVDILRARKSGVLPLPIRRSESLAYTVEHTERDDSELTQAPEDSVSAVDLSGLSAKKEVTKQDQWERKLLDLSLRNTLINARIRSTVPLLTFDFARTEDLLSEGDEYALMPRPKEWDLHIISAWGFDTVSNLSVYSELITTLAERRILHSILPDKELNTRLTRMYRSAKSAMEETGASTLFLALGLLHWYEGTSKSSRDHFAPIILIPIDILRKIGGQGYAIKKRDEDAQVNVTLLEFLRQNFKLEIPGLNPPPTDEHGLDIDKIFAIVRKAIMGQKQWSVVDASIISVFSFSQFSMWNDIHNHPDLLNRNKIVRALISGKVDWDCNIPESVNGEDAYLPVSVDASQLRAINMAANNVSFVLHGPPGTGKSQTITAMISNALTKGKTVLFVAEKMAALEVVQKRLAGLGIGDFCLELHSNKAVKRDVLNQLKRGMDIRVWGMSTDYAQKISEIHEMRMQLDSYAKVLHERRKCGLSVREMIDEYEAIPEQKTKLRLSQEFVQSIVPGDFEKHKRLLQRLTDAGRQVGHPKDNALSVIGQNEYTQSFRMHLEETLGDYENAVDELEKAAVAFAGAIGEESPVSQEQWQGLLGLASGFQKSVSLPEFLFSGEPLDIIFQLPMQYLSTKNLWKSQQEAFLQRYQESILMVNLADIAAQYEAASKKLFGKAKATETVTAILQQHVKYPVSQEMLPAIAAEVEQYRQLTASCEAAKAAIPGYWNAYLKEDSTVESLVELRNSWESQMNGMEQFLIIAPKLKADGKYNDVQQMARQFSETSDNLQKQEVVLQELLKLRNIEKHQDWLGGKKELIQLLDSSSNGLRDWISYRSVQSECESNGLQAVCRAYEGGLAHEDVIPTYMKATYKALIWAVIENEPVLNHFTGNSFNERIKEYKEMEQEFIDLTKEEMYYHLTHNLPTGHETSDTIKEMNILRKAISSGGRGVSIRALFEQIPHVLPKLCPCLLMSPISVAQYLSAEVPPFDVVIFDEASQLPTCKAVGVLARGENAVIVGDPNQMPPTSFFTGSMVDEENLDIEDLDSILDDCLALGMPEAHLQWHYRSRHESLIAFSNQEYYENSMFTFPSVNDLERRVKLCTVNGMFDRKKGRINEREGKAVVREILRRYHDEELSKLSIGVVTFNISQQGLIEDLLAEEYKKDPEFDKWANEREEELFVKNLENVQGDERDVILFSVAYGPDEEGRLSMNFGPLNKEGGWKRLNVAVSRARMEMIVFSSMTADMIDLNRTKARGVEGLQRFLAFAEKGKLTGGVPASAIAAKGITQQICTVLEAEGLKTQTNIGHSDFKIDIAVVNPYNEDEYLLGIMLDGLTYGRSRNTKDRELSQISVLRSLGWKIHRIWTMDWWDNHEKELETLRKVIDELKEAARAAAEDKKPKDDEPKSEPITYTKKPPKQRGRKPKESEEGNTDFNKFDRFRPRGSKEAEKELEEFLKDEQED